MADIHLSKYMPNCTSLVHLYYTIPFKVCQVLFQGVPLMVRWLLLSPTFLYLFGTLRLMPVFFCLFGCRYDLLTVRLSWCAFWVISHIRHILGRYSQSPFRSSMADIHILYRFSHTVILLFRYQVQRQQTCIRIYPTELL